MQLLKFDSLIRLVIVIGIMHGAAYADSVRKLIGEGNSAYAKELYDDALSAYEEASVERPESPHIYFNKGAVYYRKGDYEKAKEAFDNAAMKSKDLRLEAKARYNLGNCEFREAQRQQDSDLQKAVEAYQRSITHYQSALKLDPQMKDAAHNIEVTRLIVKDLLDKINKQKKEQEKQQQAQKQIAEKLKELAERQQALADKSKDADEDKLDDMKKEQNSVKTETEQLAKKMADQKQAQQQQQPSPMDKAQQHVENATKNQQQAERELDKKQLDKTHDEQQKAANELKEALKSLSDQQKEDQQQQQQKQQPKEQKEQQDQEQQQAQAAPDKTARDILNDEKENRKRRAVQQGSYRAVEKDW